ncbi:MAG: L-2-hydroxyglutarate oxidase [Gammaproteobacteria bacterium]|nr:L-2-hydroxyglutarate oxidase [Gammaproteobacteria bacterium]
MQYDFVIIGGGIVGVSSAWQLQTQFPGKKVLLLEKESALAQHQTGHNSGVIHAGVYYTPGSLKAQFCQQGAIATVDFCKSNNIPFDQCGKLLVATDREEYHRMLALAERCEKNGIEHELLDSKALANLEPQISGVAAIHVPTSGIVDYRLVTEAIARQFVAAGGEIRLGHHVTGLFEDENHIRIDIKSQAGNLSFRTGYLVACAGLAADRIACLMKLPIDFRIIPFRGEYYRLAEGCENIVQHLIYPIPNTELPFLGVHLTPMIDGSITIGPNAVLGFKREGYDRYNFDLLDSWETLSFPGFWKLARQHWRSAKEEFKNAWKKVDYLQQVQKYCPQLEITDLEPYPAGIRAQAVMSDGTLVHDFLFAESPRSLHVCNAPSPAATSAIPIGNHICDLVKSKQASD